MDDYEPWNEPRTTYPEPDPVEPPEGSEANQVYIPVLPTGISADAGNSLCLGSDNKYFVPGAELLQVFEGTHPEQPTDNTGEPLTGWTALADRLPSTGGGDGGGPGLDSDACLFCKNGDDIVAKYAQAKALKPSGQPLSSTNRATLIVLPGAYPVDSSLVIDAEFVDIVGLGPVRLLAGCEPAVIITGGGTVTATANNIRIQGLWANKILISGPNALQRWDACRALEFGSGSILSGTFTHCFGSNSSFGGGSGGRASGTFTNCAGASLSFGGNGSASGIFTNCTVNGSNSFGGGSAGGTFTNCTVNGGSSFGSNGMASGTFTNCTVNGGSSFGGGGTASGTFTNCTGGQGSFGGDSGTASGRFIRCTLNAGAGTFPPVFGTGKQRLCIDGNFLEVNAG